MKKKLVCLALGATLVLAGCSGNKDAANEKPSEQSQVEATEKPTTEPVQEETTGTMTVKENEKLGFSLEFNSDVFEYSENAEGADMAFFTSERGMNGNIWLTVSTTDKNVADAMEEIKMMSYVQTFTTEDTTIGKDSIPVSLIRFYNEADSDIVSYYYVWEQKVTDGTKTYVIEVTDRVKDGVEPLQAEYEKMLASFTMK